MKGADRERGSGVLWTLGVGAVLTLAVVALLLLTVAAHTRQLAAVAADMAALSAATVARDGPSDACQLAAAIATDHRGQLQACSVRGVEVELTVMVRRPVLGFPFEAIARARAGPVVLTPDPGASPRAPPRLGWTR